MKLRAALSIAILFLLSPLVVSAVHEPNAPRAPSWRDRYTLGPGDVLTFAIYGQPATKRDKLFVQPDGQITYLQATVHAEGLSIDELRARMEEILSRDYKRPRVMIAP